MRFALEYSFEMLRILLLAYLASVAGLRCMFSVREIPAILRRRSIPLIYM